jgi:hypothetical protein
LRLISRRSRFKRAFLGSKVIDFNKEEEQANREAGTKSRARRRRKDVHMGRFLVMRHAGAALSKAEKTQA